MSSYLDINKSVVISSPAGSGKTEKLARRYITLLKSGVDTERILAITFTEKAAAEMKQRILRILKEEDAALFNRLFEKISLMRVSTIHAFCGTLLRRFSFEAAIDPNYKMEEAIDSRLAWEEIIYEILMQAGKGGKGLETVMQTIGENGFRGLEDLKSAINYLYEKIPFSIEAGLFQPQADYSGITEELRSWPGAESAIGDYRRLFEDTERLALQAGLFLTKNKEPRKKVPAGLKNIVDFQGWASKMYLYWRAKNIEEYSRKAERISGIFRRCCGRYQEKKRLGGILDFGDLEYLAYKLLTENPEWANVLYAFDERTDHILVDEFQDTNNFQWAVIDKLTEEWRSGFGAKRDEGIRPTIFLVGDEKQSIYFFRGANVELFSRAREKFSRWLGDEFHYEEVKENFRSLPAITDFTNQLFSAVMTGDENNPRWRTRYSPIVHARQAAESSGRVEIILLEEDKEPVAQTRQKEAGVIAGRIRDIVEELQIFDRRAGSQKMCRYMDIAVLLRKRTHLKKYEESFRRHNIPFVVVKGIGFYQEPEVAMLRALIYFLSNPRDDYSLYALLKSPFFFIKEDAIVRAMKAGGDCLFTNLKNCSGGELENAVTFFEEWLSQLPRVPVAELIEDALVKTRAWEYFYEAQRRANIKKFIRIVEDLEACGKSVLKIKAFLEQTYDEDKEPKANVNTEGMDAVRIMTIHESKGLEFPVVFVPGIEDPFRAKTGDCLVYEDSGRLFFKYAPEPSIRKQDGDFLLHIEKEKEEQKRLFYVAVTRAEDALFLTGKWNDSDNNFLSYLKQGLGLKQSGLGYETAVALEGLSVLPSGDADALSEKTPGLKPHKAVIRPAAYIPLTSMERQPWKAVTAVDIRRRHEKQWLILGDVLHRIFEGVSKGFFDEGMIIPNAEGLLVSKGISKEERGSLLSIIEGDINLLKQKGIWQEIILPQDDSYAELPFMLEMEHKNDSPNPVVYAGRIDRVIIKDGAYNIYDYKTFPVEKREMDYFLKEYSFQLGIYKKAVRNIFKAEKVKSFIVFTHAGEVREV